MSSISKKHVDFSVIIPTYNRSKFLKLSILSALRQKGVSLEVIVSDDCSTDDTKELVESLRDKRIKYSKNNKRLGTAMNFQKCFFRSSGSYIFTLGDDDLILDEYTLIDILVVMKKYKLGMGKIGTITYENDLKAPYQVSILGDKLIVHTPDKTSNILTDSIDFGLGFFSGLIFDNVRLDKMQLRLDHTCHPNHMCPIERAAAYDLITKYGIAYIPHHFIVSRLSLQLIPRYFNLQTSGWFFMEKPITLAGDFIGGKQFEHFKRTYLRKQLVLLPNIKFFSDLGNYIRVLQRMVTIDETLLIDSGFLLWALVGFMPKFVINGLRNFKIIYSRRYVNKILEKYKYYQKIAGFNIPNSDIYQFQ